MKVTEQIIAKANLSNKEKKVARVFHGLSSAGPRTEKWVEALRRETRAELLDSAQEKILNALRVKRSKGSGK